MPYESAVELAARIRRGEVSCREVVRTHLDRIDEVDPVLNAVVARDDGAAMAAAEAADAAQARGADLSPLHGLPFTLKDSIDTAGLTTTAATAGWRDRVPDRDATVAARMRAAGGILLGKTNTPEITFGIGTTNDLHGTTVNPYDPTRSSHGSSGGAAALLAAGGTTLEVGSDTGGSVREPAHACGVVGLKPTNGRMPMTGHTPPRAFGAVGSITTVGPMARTVADVALLYRVLAGPDGVDFSVPPVPVDDPIGHDDLSGGRVRWYVDNGEVAATDDVTAAVEDSATVLADRGAEVRHGFPDALVGAVDLYVRFLQGGAAGRIRRALDRAGTTTPTAGLAERLVAGDAGTAEQLDAVVEEVDLFRRRMQELAADVDALVCPIIPTAALPVAEMLVGDDYALWGLEAVFNLCGWPAVAVRAGTSPEGLPIGVQVAAPPWREDVCLGLAAAIEADLGGFVPPNL